MQCKHFHTLKLDIYYPKSFKNILKHYLLAEIIFYLYWSDIKRRLWLLQQPWPRHRYHLRSGKCLGMHCCMFGRTSLCDLFLLPIDYDVLWNTQHVRQHEFELKLKIVKIITLECHFAIQYFKRCDIFWAHDSWPPMKFLWCLPYGLHGEYCLQTKMDNAKKQYFLLRITM